MDGIEIDTDLEENGFPLITNIDDEIISPSQLLKNLT